MSRLSSLLRRAANRLESNTAQFAVPQSHVGEITPCAPRPDSWQGKRLNLMLPSINKQHYFGGIHTAVLIYRELCRHFPASRIVLTDSSPDAEALSRFDDHVLVPANESSNAARQIVPFSDRYGKTLPVASEDIWVATAWWTAYAAQRMACWQRETGGCESPLIYLIQDFEPGFYAWSSQYALALSTYRPEQDIAVFNTALLADFFDRQGFEYARRSVFEPVLHDGLKSVLGSLRSSSLPRKRRIVVYARPGTPRNAFELICEGLRQWGWTDPRSAEWDVAAPGELASDLDLGPFALKALGKLDIHSYADLLSTSAIGVSLMISPHPSYPPLEMDAFGMRVITNRYGSKDLELGSQNTHSLLAMTPEDICSLLVKLVTECEDGGMAAGAIADYGHPMMQAGGFSDVASQVMAELLSR